MSARFFRFAVLVAFAVLAALGTASAETPVAGSARPAAQGVAVLGIGRAPEVREAASALARAVYASSLRPQKLDELRARILAGEAAPPGVVKDVRELAELRAALSNAAQIEDASSRRLLASIADQLNVAALLVLVQASVAGPDASADAGVDAPESKPTAPSWSARLFVLERGDGQASGDFDAARYEPDATEEGSPPAPIPTSASWRKTVRSLVGRFPAPPPVKPELRAVPPPQLASDARDSKPFYKSPWLWGALGAALLVGGLFFFGSQDTSDDPIHVQMRVPR
jgi:hypothetical protein